MIFVIRVICGDYIFGKNTKKGDWCHYLGPNSFFHYVSSRNLDRPLGWIWSSLHMRANYASTSNKWNPRIWSWTCCRNLSWFHWYHKMKIWLHEFSQMSEIYLFLLWKEIFLCLIDIMKFHQHHTSDHIFSSPLNVSRYVNVPNYNEKLDMSNFSFIIIWLDYELNQLDNF